VEQQTSQATNDSDRRIQELEAKVRALQNENAMLKEDKEKLTIKMESIKESSKALVDQIEDRYFQLNRSLIKREAQLEEMTKRVQAYPCYILFTTLLNFLVMSKR
jgi:hypothetical protein